MALILGIASTLGAAPVATKVRTPLSLKTVLQSVTELMPVVTANALPNSTSTDIVVAVEASGNVRVSSQFIIDNALFKTGEEPSPARISRAVKNLQSLGLFREVTSQVRRVESGKVLMLRVSENPVADSIRFDGASVFDNGELARLLATRTNDVINMVQLRKDVKVIEKFYHDNGYEEAKVLSFDVPDGVSGELVIHVSEGILERVAVTGNTKTKDYVILREMVSKPGQPVRRITLQKDFQRINNLGYFTAVYPEIRPGVTPNSMDLTWVVEEKESNATFTMGGGYSPTAGFSFFSNIFWDNFLGTGQLVSARAQLGIASTYELKYSNPWAWDDRKSLTLRTWLRDGQVDQFLPNSNSVGYRNERSNGVDVEIGWPFSYEFYSTHTVKYESVDLREVHKSYNLISYALGLNYDTRDVRFNPLSGELYTLRIEKAFKVDNQSMDMTRFDLDLRNYIKIADQQTIATRLALGYLTSPQINDQDLFLREYYRVGGANTVRGWNDYYPFSVGTEQVLSSIEYRYLFTDSFSAVLFADAGYSTKGTWFNFTKARIGKGVGIRFAIPMLGPIRLDWAFNDYGDSMVHVSIGQAF